VLSSSGRRNPRPRAGLGTWPAATTVLAGVIGDPVEHSLSPALHNAALVELGLDWAYVAFPVPAGRGQAAVAAMVDLGIRGLSVTMPHKAGAAKACHQLSPLAERLGVVNTVTNVGGELVGDSTDGPGFVDSLAELGWSPDGKRCLVLGAGGSARAVVLALGAAGAKRVEVVARRPEQGQEAAALAGEAGMVATVGSVEEADLVVNATPVGMAGGTSRRERGVALWPGTEEVGAWPTGGGLDLRSGHDAAAGFGSCAWRRHVQRPGHARPPSCAPVDDLDRQGCSDRGDVGGSVARVGQACRDREVEGTAPSRRDGAVRIGALQGIGGPRRLLVLSTSLKKMPKNRP
jgi:shikimate dehydrogenase